MSSVAKMIACLVVLSALCQALPAKVPSSGWKTYHNKDYGFSLAYPRDLTFYSARPDYKETQLSYISVCDWTTIACFEYNGHEYEGTTFEAAGVSINVLRDLRTTADCRKIDTGQYPIKQTIINGVRFFFGTTADAGTSHVRAGPAYRTFREGVCFELVVGIATSNIGAYDPGTMKEYRSTRLDHELEAVVRTFRFVGPVVDGADWKVYHAHNCGGVFEHPDDDEVETTKEYPGDEIFPDDPTCQDGFKHAGLNYTLTVKILRDGKSPDEWLKASGRPPLSQAEVLTKDQNYNSYNAGPYRYVFGQVELFILCVTDAKGKAVDPKDDKVFRHFAESFRVE